MATSDYGWRLEIGDVSGVMIRWLMVGGGQVGVEVRLMSFW